MAPRTGLSSSSNSMRNRTAEFQLIRVEDPDRAAHLWDALDDLERFIVDLAIEQGTQRSDCGRL